jgi:hypothetical protein
MKQFLWMSLLFTLSVPVSARALETGEYFSKNANTGRLVVRAWGQGYTIDSCAYYDGIGCLPLTAAVFPSGANWQGEGSMTVVYQNAQRRLDCAYSIEAKLSVSPDGKTYLALALPQAMYQQVTRCPTRREVGANQWHYLQHPYAKR